MIDPYGKPILEGAARVRSVMKNTIYYLPGMGGHLIG
jgi:hypothetical protein